MNSDQRLYELYLEFAEANGRRAQTGEAADAYSLALYYARRLGDAEKIDHCRDQVAQLNPNHILSHQTSAPLFFAQLLMRYPADEVQHALSIMTGETLIQTPPAVSSTNTKSQAASAEESSHATSTMEAGSATAVEEMPSDESLNDGTSSFEDNNISSDTVVESASTLFGEEEPAEKLFPRYVDDELHEPVAPMDTYGLALVENGGIVTGPSMDSMAYSATLTTPLDWTDTYSAMQPAHHLPAIPESLMQTHSSPVLDTTSSRSSATGFAAPVTTSEKTTSDKDKMSWPAERSTAPAPLVEHRVPPPPPVENHHVFDLGTSVAAQRLQSLRVAEDFLLKERELDEPITQPSDEPSMIRWLINAAAFFTVLFGASALTFFACQIYPMVAPAVNTDEVVNTLLGEDFLPSKPKLPPIALDLDQSEKASPPVAANQTGSSASVKSAKSADSKKDPIQEVPRVSAIPPAPNKLR